MNAGVVPSEGIVGYDGARIAPEEVWCGWLGKSFEIADWRWIKSPFFIRWFALRKNQGQTVADAEADYDSLVRKVVAVLPEIDEALRLGKCGRHVRLVRISR